LTDSAIGVIRPTATSEQSYKMETN
jgi:hypothetical protein